MQTTDSHVHLKELYHW